jgi:predicted dehydrogenase
MKQVRVGIVGSGFAGRFHAQSLQRVYGVAVELAGVTSLRPERRQAFAAEYGIPAFDSLAAMLPEVDVVDICTPPYAHEDAILAAARAGKGIICEKPLTGYFGPPGAGDKFRGDRASKREMLREVVKRLKRMAQVVRKHGILFGFAENFVYAPCVQKEREIVEKTGAQLLRMTGEESHNGSHSPTYGIWRLSGGGSLVGKGVHPLGGILYLKRIEGLARHGKPIRPAAVSARMHQITRLKDFQDAGFIRTSYHDIEDYAQMHLVFGDGTVADIFSSELVLGGLYSFIEVFANNHRTMCRISPAALLDTYNPKADQFKDVYLIEKITSKEGWAHVSPDENFTIGYLAEAQDFVVCAANGTQPQSGLDLALDSTAVMYAAYLSDEKKGAEVAVPVV